MQWFGSVNSVKQRRKKNKTVHSQWSLEQKLQSHFHFQGYDLWVCPTDFNKKKQFIVIFFFFLKKIKKRHKSHFKRLYFTFVKKMCLLINNSGRCNKWRYLHRNSPDPNVDRHIFDGLRHRWLIEQFAMPWLQFSIFLHYALFCSFNRAYSFQFVNNRFIQKTNSKK